MIRFEMAVPPVLANVTAVAWVQEGGNRETDCAQSKVGDQLLISHAPRLCDGSSSDPLEAGLRLGEGGGTVVKLTTAELGFLSLDESESCSIGSEIRIEGLRDADACCCCCC